MKKIKIILSFILLAIVIMFTNINTLKAKTIINKENEVVSLNNIPGTMEVKFTEEGKSPIYLSESTIYNGWNHNNIGKISISLFNLDTDVVYKLVISMDNIIYSPVDVLPNIGGATTEFEKNDPIPINGNKEYAGMPYSGTIVYTFNSESSKTFEVENFELQFKYDAVLWNNLGNVNLGDGVNPLLSVKLVVEEDTVLDEKNILNATTEKKGEHSYNANFRFGSNLSSSSLQVCANDELTFAISNDSSYSFDAQYYKKMNIEFNVPKYTHNGTTYYLEYEESDIRIYIEKSTSLSKKYYTLVATEDKILIELTDYMIDENAASLLNIKFTVPEIAELQSVSGLYKFTGNVKAYLDDDPNLSIFSSEKNFTITLNTNLESQLKISSADNSIDYRNDTIVQPLFGLGLTNNGGNSGKIKLVYDFDIDLTDENTILVTTMRLLPDNTSQNFEIKYSLRDELGNTIYFDSNGNVVPVGTEGATEYWTITISNKHYNKTMAYNASILFNRSNLRSDHRQYYFKTIEYVLGGLNSGSTLWHQSARFSYSSSTGTIWGYTRFTKASQNVVSNVKVYEADANDIFELKFDKNLLTKSTKTDSNAYGMTNGKVSTNSIDAGNTFTVSGRITTLSYPYTANNILNTIDNNLILGFRLPEGVTINSSGTKFTDTTNKKVINVKSITSCPLDDGYNLWIVELEGGHLIGYCSESLGAISTGSYINFTIEFNTSLATSGTTLYIKDMVYVTAKGIANKADGSYKDMKVVDKYDISGDGSYTDYVGCFSSDNNSLMIQIIAADATLDINYEMSIDGTTIGSRDTQLGDYDDNLLYELIINCTSGGKAEDFVYYIPIVKQSSIIDNQLIFSADYSLKLTEIPVVINSIEGNGIKILYSFDTNVTYDNATTSIWYETIPTDKTLEEVTLIKVIPESGIIENGSVSVLRVPIAYEGDLDEYISNAGMLNSWSSRGQYKFLIGNRGVAGHYSTEKSNIKINYTYDQKIIELTTTTGNHDDNIGNDSYLLEILSEFKKEQNFNILSVSTYNAIVTSVTNMETNAHLLTGDDANRTFAFFVKLDSNTKKDLSEKNALLGNVSTYSNFKINFEIFNADVISDITTIRYVDIIIQSDNGITLPVRINIKRELTVIGTVNNSISSGKQYILFGTTQTEIVISKDSSFTAQFSAENIIPNNYKGRKLIFENKLPAGTKIVLIDLTYTDNIKYYVYEVNGSDTNIINLTKFNVMGSSSKYTTTTGFDSITEKYLFIVELPDNNTIADNTTNSINLARTLNSDIDEMSPNGLKFTTKKVREYDLEYSSNQQIGEEIEIEYTISDIDYSDSKYNDRKLALSISPSSTLPIINSYIEYNGETYYLNSDNEFLIPLGDAQTVGTYNLKFNYYCQTIEYYEKTCMLNIKLIVSATANAERPHLGETLKEIDINLTSNTRPSFEVESMPNRWLSKEDLKNTVQVKYNTLNVNGKVTIELQKKIGEGYTTDSTLLEAVNGSTTQTSGQFTITGITTLNLKFSELMENGNYQLLFTIYDNDGNELKVISYKFIVYN